MRLLADIWSQHHRSATHVAFAKTGEGVGDPVEELVGKLIFTLQYLMGLLVCLHRYQRLMLAFHVDPLRLWPGGCLTLFKRISRLPIFFFLPLNPSGIYRVFDDGQDCGRGPISSGI